MRTTAAIAGATTAVGRALAEQLRLEHDVIALTPAEQPDRPGAVKFRSCDLFNLRDAERALSGVDTAFYVADAVSRSLRLSQGSREDLDLLCADTFARAARKNGVRSLVYVGGVGGLLAEEVERTLGSYGIPVTARRVPVETAAAPTARANLLARVRSVQRLPAPQGRDARWVAREYFEWLPRSLQLVRIDGDAARALQFYVRGLPTPILVLEHAGERSAPDRELYLVTGGLLAHSEGVEARARLEFRSVLGGEFVIAALHDFCPRLPWLLYELTQARVHLLVMERFAAHLAALTRPTVATADSRR